MPITLPGWEGGGGVGRVGLRMWVTHKSNQSFYATQRETAVKRNVSGRRPRGKSRGLFSLCCTHTVKARWRRPRKAEQITGFARRDGKRWPECHDGVGTLRIDLRDSVPDMLRYAENAYSHYPPPPPKLQSFCPVNPQLLQNYHEDAKGGGGWTNFKSPH